MLWCLGGVKGLSLHSNKYSFKLPYVLAKCFRHGLGHFVKLSATSQHSVGASNSTRGCKS